MHRDKILSVSFGILYYILTPIFFFYLYIFEALTGSISDFSETLFYIVYVVIPIILVLMPILLKIILGKKFYKTILYSCLGFAIYILIIISLKFSIDMYFKTFTIEKWSNNNWHGFRYLMIDDMEKKYDFIGMNKNEIYDILGKEDKELEGEYVICYSMRNGFFEGDYYLIYLNEDDIVIKTDNTHWD